MSDQDDTQDNDSGETVGSRNDDRLAMLGQIGDSAEARRADEFDEGQEFSGDETLIDDHHEAQEHVAKLPKIKVNGQEIELTQEMIERAQKVEAADQYLAEASRMKREAEAQYARPSQRDAEQHVEVDDMALVRALQMGTEEEAAAAIRALRTPSLSRDETLAAVRDQIAMDEAVKGFQSSYPEIWSDPMLKKLAFDRDNELIRTEPNLDYASRYDKVGKELMAWSGKFKGSFSEKKERKEAASENVVQISSRRAEPVQEQEQEEGTTDIIAAMAQRRGQQI